jgi:hypothetical protein
LKYIPTRSLAPAALAPTLLACSCALLLLPSASFAQTAVFNPPPVPKANPRAPVSIPSTIEPVDPAGANLFHHLAVSIETGRGRKTSKSTDLPERADTTDTTLAVGFRAGEGYFGNVSLGFSSSDFSSRNSPANGAIQINGSAKTTGVRLTGGYYFLPNLLAGVSIGSNDVAGGYQYQIAVPRTDTSGDGLSKGAFVTAYLPLDAWLLSGSVAYHVSTQTQKYSNNVPPDQESRFNVLATTLGASRMLNDSIRVSGGLTFNHTVNQSSLGGVKSLADNWTTLALSAGYRINRSFEVNVGVSTWLGNDKSNYDQVKLGLMYRY